MTVTVDCTVEMQARFSLNQAGRRGARNTGDGPRPLSESPGEQS
jgi:hypothetical protein